jgi:hypothetical protein
MIDRQAAEAANQAKLALWLHLELPNARRAEGTEGKQNGRTPG